MPRVSVLMVRTALLQLAGGATLGGLMLADKGLHLTPWIWGWRPGHIQMMIFGWTLQLACGVAVWIMPRLDTSGGRGDLRLVWAGYAALNLAVLLSTLHAPLAGLVGRQALSWMLPAAAAGYVLAFVAVARHLWLRALPFGAQLPSQSSREGA